MNTPVQVADDLLELVVAGVPVTQFTVSSEGTLAFVSGTAPAWRLVSVNREGGTPIRLTEAARRYRYPTVSPDGQQVAVRIDETRSDIYVVDGERRVLRQLTRIVTNTLPSWVDADVLSFSSRRQGTESWDIFSRPSDERTPAEPLLTADRAQLPTGWSRDGGALAYYELNNETGRDIWIWRVGEDETDLVVGTDSNERGAKFAPDGEWLAYVSDELGQDDVYVQPYPGPGGREVVSIDGGREPVWSPRGRELFFRSGSRLMSVEVGGSERITPPRLVLVLNVGNYVSAAPEVGLPNYDVFPDGRTFVMVQREQLGPAPQLRIVLNDLARRMVCEWGMSEVVGPLTFGQKEAQIFLGRDVAQQKDYSEETANTIDQEIKRIVTKNYDRARSILREQRRALQQIADALLTLEALSGGQATRIISGQPLAVPITSDQPSTSVSETGVTPRRRSTLCSVKAEWGKFGRPPTRNWAARSL